MGLLAVVGGVVLAVLIGIGLSTFINYLARNGEKKRSARK